MPFRCHGDADGPRARTDIKYPGACASERIPKSQHFLDETFCLGSRNEHGGGYGEVEGPELAPAPDIGHGLTALAPPGQHEDPVDLLIVKLEREVPVQIGAFLAEAEGEQDLGVEPRGLDARPFEHLGEAGENPGDGAFVFPWHPLILSST